MGEQGLKLKHGEITDRILHVFFKKVYVQLGYGFLEKVYENAMAIELRRMRFDVQQQAPVSVLYEQEIVGQYYADLLVDRKVMVEIKAARRLLDEHEAQLLNYLRATPYEVGLILNFGPRAEFKRKAFDNANKPSLTWIATTSLETPPIE